MKFIFVNKIIEPKVALDIKYELAPKYGIGACARVAGVLGTNVQARAFVFLVDLRFYGPSLCYRLFWLVVLLPFLVAVNH